MRARPFPTLILEVLSMGGRLFSELAEAQISLCFKLCVQHCWPIYPLSARCADLLREEVTGAMVTLLFYIYCICMRLYNSWGWNLQSFDWCIKLSLFASVFPNLVVSWSLFGWGQPRSLFEEIAVLHCCLCLWYEGGNFLVLGVSALQLALLCQRASQLTTTLPRQRGWTNLWLPHKWRLIVVVLNIQKCTRDNTT